MNSDKKESSALEIGIAAGIFGVAAGFFGKLLYDEYVEDNDKTKAKQQVMEKEKKKVNEESDGTEWFICPISYEVMTDPVSTPEGITYDRKAIIKWLETRNYCPKTNKKLELKDLRPNYALKEAIHSMILKGGYSDSTVGKN